MLLVASLVFSEEGAATQATFSFETLFPSERRLNIRDIRSRSSACSRFLSLGIGSLITGETPLRILVD